MPKTSLVLFNRLIACTLSIFLDVQKQIRSKEHKKWSILNSYLQSEYDAFIEEINVYKSLEVLPNGLTEELFTESVRTIKSLFLEIIASFDCTSDTPTQSTTPIWNPLHQNSNFALPKLKIQHFSGQYHTWSTFYAKFISMVDSRSDLSNVDKLQYLLTLLDPDPLAVIDYLPLISESYQIALDLLCKRYKNEKREIAYHATKLLNLPKIDSSDVNSIRKFVDSHNVHFSSLQSIPNFDVFNAFFGTFILSRFDNQLASRFDEKTAAATSFPKLDTIMTFLESEAKHAENIETLSYIATSEPSTSKLHSRTSVKTDVKTTSSRQKPLPSLIVATPTCILCNGNAHKLATCSSFVNKTPQERFDFAKQSKLCINCLGNHFISRCTSKFTCRTCSRKHHTLLHFDHRSSSPTLSNTSSSSKKTQSKPIVVSQSSSKPNEQTSLVVDAQSTSTVLLATALIVLKTSDANFLVVRAILDTASHASFISERCAQALQCKRNRTVVPISGIGSTPTTSNGTCLLQVDSLSGTTVSDSHLFFILNRITNNLPQYQIDSKVKGQFSKFLLADPTFDTPSGVDVLLGADLTISALAGAPFRIAPDLPFVLPTVFGYAIIGAAPTHCTIAAVSLCSLHVDQTKDPSYCSHHIADDENLSLQVQKFWTHEEPPSQPTPSTKEDLHCETFYLSTVSRDCSGRYQVRLPFKPNSTHTLGKSYSFAYNCLLSLEHRFAKNSSLKEKYIRFMRDYLQAGHMRVLPEGLEPKCVIPHHGVFKTHGDTEKLRVVFNGSSKTSSGYSLNDLLYVGTKLQPLITDVIHRFRQYPFVFSCDIKQMYRQISVHPEDQLYQCVLWRESPNRPVQVFALTTVTYGLASSPYLAIRTIAQLVRDEGHKFPSAANILRNNIFVDDIVTGAFSLTDALLLKTDLGSLLALGCFELRKWSSNSSKLLEDIPNEHQELVKSLDSKNSCVFILGFNWNPQSDSFTLQLPLVSASLLDQPTKRKLLSFIAQIYDPCGWISPFVMQAKLLLQQLWLLSLAWDDPLPKHLVTDWKILFDSFKTRVSFTIPRLVVIPFAKYQLHGFCDASQKGYAAVVYLRSESNIVSTSLLLSKTRVAPLKTISLPRLELLGAHLLSQLVHSILEVSQNLLSFESIHLWCDSTIVLTWLKTLPFQLKTFVANRVSTIQETTQPHWWHHVPSELNAADLPSRGLEAFDSLNNSNWLGGPFWLLKPKEQWPQTSHAVSPREMLEFKSTSLVVTAQSPENNFLSHISSWSRTIRVVSHILRCWSRNPPSSHLDSYRRAEIAICKFIQSVSFTQEIKNLKSGTVCQPKVQMLSPFLDDDIIRVGGRLSDSLLPMSQKHPILLPKAHPLVVALVDYYHTLHAHCGPSLLQTLLSQKFWILSIRSVVRSRVHKCIRCFRAKPVNSAPFMGQLPRSRVSPSPPFYHTGMDFAGPFQIKISPLRKASILKYYVCVFVCFATKAAHLEVATDLSTPGFIDCLSRFVSRRGNPAHLYSDCGTNFIGASKELRQLLKSSLQTPKNQSDISDFTSSRGINFHFLPASSPHQGGIWERLVQSVKYHLRRVVGTHTLTLIQFVSLLTRIEAILNSRPLSSVSTDPNDLSYLSPGHFLIGRPITSFPEPDLTHTPDNRIKHFQLVQALSQRFWKIWHLQYLPTLQKRSKWTSHKPNLQVNDLVLVAENNAPPFIGQWDASSKPFLVETMWSELRVCALEKASTLDLS